MRLAHPVPPFLRDLYNLRNPHAQVGVERLLADDAGGTGEGNEEEAENAP